MVNSPLIRPYLLGGGGSFGGGTLFRRSCHSSEPVWRIASVQQERLSSQKAEERMRNRDTRVATRKTRF